MTDDFINELADDLGNDPIMMSEPVTLSEKQMGQLIDDKLAPSEITGNM